jgi:hypothetical protein
MSTINAPCRSLVRGRATRSLIGAQRFQARGLGLGRSFHARFPTRATSKRRGSILRPISPRRWYKPVHRSARVRGRHTPAVN